MNIKIRNISINDNSLTNEQKEKMEQDLRESLNHIFKTK